MHSRHAVADFQEQPLFPSHTNVMKEVVSDISYPIRIKSTTCWIKILKPSAKISVFTLNEVSEQASAEFYPICTFPPQYGAAYPI